LNYDAKCHFDGASATEKSIFYDIFLIIAVNDLISPQCHLRAGGDSLF